jgi:hypothetical protein
MPTPSEIYKTIKELAEFAGIILNAKDLSDLILEFQSADALGIFLKSAGKILNQEKEYFERTKGIHLSFDLSVLQKKLTQRGIDFKNLPVTPNVLYSEIGNDIASILLDKDFVVGADLDKNWSERIARDIIHSYAELFKKKLVDFANRNDLQYITANVESLKKSIEDIALHQDTFLQQVIGISNQIAIQSTELSPPDTVALRPVIFLQREELIQELQENLRNTTCLALVDGSGKGKTQLVVSLFELHQGAKYWITLRNKNNLQDKHIRVQVIRWLFQVTGNSSYWSQYLLGDITFDSVCVALGRALGNQGLLIIDDLPNPLEAGSLYDDLEIIIRTFSEAGLKIIITSQWQLPPNLETHFSSLIITHACPSFSQDEVSAFLSHIQIPNALQSEKIATLVSATTKGHPLLVAATISWLDKQGADFRIEIFDGLLTGEPLKDTLEYSRKVLIRTLLNEDAKELLYRLSIIGEKLDKKLVFDVANVPPTIRRPAEKFDELVGPWVEKLDNDYFDVSPLLARAGENNIAIEVQKQIHLICADRYLQNHNVNISDLLTILSHLWQAQDYVRFSHVLMLALMAAKTYEEAKYIDWACSLLLDIPWPDELSLHWRIMIRAAQLRTLALAKGKLKKLITDLESLIQLANAESNTEQIAQSLLFAHMNLGFFAEDLPVEIVIPHSFAAVNLLYFSSDLKKEFLPELIEKLPDMLWANAFRIKTREHIKLFLDELNQVDKTLRELFYVAPLAAELSSRIIDQSWYSEGEKKQEEQNWFGVLSYLEQLSTMTCVQESDCLSVAVARAKAVIYADYLKQTDQAIAILDELPDLNNPDISFLVNYSKGCFAFSAEHNLAAIDFLNNAENTTGNDFSYYRFETTKKLAIALEKRGEWEPAKRYCIKALLKIKNIKENEGLDELEFCELLGELAYIHWNLQKPEKSCGAMYGYIRKLIKNKDVDSSRYKEVFNKAGHALGWFLSMAKWGTPPQKTLQGEDYAPIQPGLFGIRRMAMGEFVSPMGFASSHLLRQVALFANGLSLFRTSRNVFKLSIEYSQYEKRNDVHSLSAYPELASLEVVLGDAHNSLDYSILARQFFFSVSAISKGSKPSDYLTDLAKTINSNESNLTKTQRRKAEESLILTTFIPLFCKLIGSDLSVDSLLRELEYWKLEILSMKSEFFLAEDWLNLIEYFKDMVLFWKSDGELDNNFILFGNRNHFEMLSTLLSSDKSDIILSDVYISHVRVAISLRNYGEYARYMCWGIGKFIHRYWLRTAQTKRFALRHPDLFAEKITSISPNNGADTLYDVLISAGQAVNVRLSENTMAELKKIKKMARPWL